MNRAKKVSFTYINEPQTDSFIYGLIDPRNGHLRYIGQTYWGKRRFCCLVSKYALKPKTHKVSWIKSLLDKGLLPQIIILEEAPVAQLSELEIFYIEYFKSLGCKLTNTTAGGEGTRYKHSEERKLKQRATHVMNKPVIDINSYEVFQSVMECSRQLKISNGSLSDHLNRKKNMSSVKKRQFAWLPKDITDIEGWCEEQRKSLNKPNNKMKRVICLNTGVVYPTMKSAAEAYGKSSAWVYAIVNKKLLSEPEIKFEFYHE